MSAPSPLIAELLDALQALATYYQRLEREGLVKTEPYKPVELTARGKRLARQCKERHDTVYRFLLAIGVDPDVAAVDAEGIEHHVSRPTLERFREIADDQA